MASSTISTAEGALPRPEAPRLSAVPEDICHYIAVNPALYPEVTQGVRDDEGSTNDTTTPSDAAAEPVMHLSALEMQGNNDTLGQIILDTSNPMDVDGTNPLLSESRDTSREVYTRENQLDVVPQFHTGSNTASNAPEVKECTVAESQVEKPEISDLSIERVFEMEAAFHVNQDQGRAVRGYSSVQPHSEASANIVCGKTHTSMAKDDRVLGRRGDESQQQMCLSNPSIPANVVGQMQQSLEPQNLFLNASVPGTIPLNPWSSWAQAEHSYLHNVEVQAEHASARKSGFAVLPTLKVGSCDFEVQMSQPANLAGPPHQVETIASPFVFVPAHFDGANLDIDTIRSQRQTFGRIEDRLSGNILAAGPEQFGITEVTNENGIVLYDARTSRRNSEAVMQSRMQEMNQHIADVAEIHVDDDLVGAFAVGSPPEKWRRLMSFSKEDGIGQGSVYVHPEPR